MPKAKFSSLDLQRQFVTALTMALFAVVGITLVDMAGAADFGPYFGPVEPTLAAFCVALAGIGALRVLSSQNWYSLGDLAPAVGTLFRAAFFAIPFALAAIATDLTFRFSQDLNVPLPWSLAFYPAMAFMAEICFHLVPLAILLAMANLLFRPPIPEAAVWAMILLAAAIEPAFQISGSYADPNKALVNACVAANVYAFNLFELVLFRRYGFEAMYLARLIYYLIWHIAWGSARLALLF